MDVDAEVMVPAWAARGIELVLVHVTCPMNRDHVDAKRLQLTLQGAADALAIERWAGEVEIATCSVAGRCTGTSQCKHRDTPLDIKLDEPLESTLDGSQRVRRRVEERAASRGAAERERSRRAALWGRVLSRHRGGRPG